MKPVQNLKKYSGLKLFIGGLVLNPEDSKDFRQITKFCLHFYPPKSLESLSLFYDLGRTFFIDFFGEKKPYTPISVIKVFKQVQRIFLTFFSYVSLGS